MRKRRNVGTEERGNVGAGNGETEKLRKVGTVEGGSNKAVEQ